MSKSALLTLSLLIVSFSNQIALAQSAAPAATPAPITPGQGTPPPQPRAGWVTTMTSVAGTEKFNARAKAINDGLEYWFSTSVVDGKAPGSGYLLNMLNEKCRGVTSEQMSGGLAELAGPIHSGVCGQWKSDMSAYYEGGRTRNFAFCSNFRGAVRSIDRMRSNPNIWWYVGVEADRLQRNLTRLGNTEIGWSKEYINDRGEVVGRENKTIIGILTGRPKPAVSCPI
jgi:hypothetical protein